MTYPPPGLPVEEPKRPIGQLVFGAVLVLIGVGWLITALDLFTIPWRGVMAAVLIVIGVTIVASARTRPHRGLVTVGVILTLVLALFSSIEGLSAAPLRGGIGERHYTPVDAGAIEDSYHLAIGELILDMRDVTLPEGETSITATVTIGQLTIHVPADVALRVDGTVTAGELTVTLVAADGSRQDRTIDGVGIDETIEEAGYADAPRRLHLDVAVGLGAAEVKR